MVVRHCADTFFAALIARYDLKWSKGGRREKGFIRPLRSGLTISRARHSDDGHMRRHLDREIAAVAAAGRHSDESDN